MVFKRWNFLIPNPDGKQFSFFFLTAVALPALLLKSSGLRDPAKILVQIEKKGEGFVCVSEGKIIQATLLDIDPICIYSAQIESPRSALKSLSPLIPDVTIIYFVRIAWSVENPGHYQYTMASLAQFQAEFPNHKVYFVCNTREESDILRRDHVPHIVSNANCLIDERLFTIQQQSKPIYDAVYNAQMAEWKRHNLARNVPRLALAYHSFDDTLLPYYNRLRAEMPNAVFLNHDSLPTPRDMTAAELQAVYNASHCGLCLSEEEGVMSVAVEYLLSGIPIVTTRSRGGRDEFFDDENAIYVEAEAHSVAEGVALWKNRSVDKYKLRKKTVAKQQLLRKSFIRQVERVIRLNGGSPSLSRNWSNVFQNKLQGWDEAGNFLKTIRAASSIRP